MCLNASLRCHILSFYLLQSLVPRPAAARCSCMCVINVPLKRPVCFPKCRRLLVHYSCTFKSATGLVHNTTSSSASPSVSTSWHLQCGRPPLPSLSSFIAFHNGSTNRATPTQAVTPSQTDATKVSSTNSSVVAVVSF